MNQMMTMITREGLVNETVALTMQMTRVSNVR